MTDATQNTMRRCRLPTQHRDDGTPSVAAVVRIGEGCRSRVPERSGLGVRQVATDRSAGVLA